MKTYKNLKIIVIIAIVVAAFFLLKKPISSHIIKEQKSAKRRKLAMDLQYSMPVFDGLVDFIRGDMKKIDRIDLINYANYFEKLSKLFPDSPDPYNMLGFCYYNLGDYKESVKAYLKAVNLSPDFFWSGYSLAIIYTKKGLYTQAAQLLTGILSAKPEITLKTIYSSRVYGLMRNKDGRFEIDITGRLKNGYQKAANLLQAFREPANVRNIISNDKTFQISCF